MLSESRTAEAAAIPELVKTVKPVGARRFCHTIPLPRGETHGGIPAESCPSHVTQVPCLWSLSSHFPTLKFEHKTRAWKAQHPAKCPAQICLLRSSVLPVSHGPRLHLQDPGPCCFSFLWSPPREGETGVAGATCCILDPQN